MSVAKRFLRNICSSWAGSFIYAATAFILTPVVLASLGTTHFALWSLVTGFTGYYGLLDLGFRAGLNRYIAKYRAAGDWEMLNRVASTGTAVLILCGMLLWCVTWVLTYAAPYMFSTTPADTSPLRWSIFLLGSSVALQFPFFVQSAVFVATQRFDLANLIGIAGRLAQTALVFAAVTLGFGLVGLSAAVAITELGTYALRYRIAKRLIPEMQIAPRFICRSTFLTFAQYSGWATMSHLSSALVGTSDRYVIAFLLGTTSVTRFHLAFTIVAQLRQVFSPFARVIYPELCDTDEAGQKQRFVALYITGTRMVALLAVPVVMIGWVWAPEFYRLWIGPDAFEDGLPSAASIFRILVLGAVIRMPQGIGYQVFHARFRLPLLSTIFLAEAVTNVVLSLVLGRTWGLIGVAWATVLTSVFFELGVLPKIISRELGIPLHWLLGATWLRPLLVGSLLAAAIVIIRSAYVVETWGMLMATGVITGCIALFLMACLGLEPEQRNRFVWSPLVRFWGARFSSTP